MDLEMIMLSEVTQTQKNKYHKFFFFLYTDPNF